MQLQNKEKDMPEVIYEGYKFPDQYAVYGKTDITQLNENNSTATVYVGERSEIEKLLQKINNVLGYEAFDDSNGESFVVVGLYDNFTHKSDNDYIMLATIASHNVNSFEFLDVPNNVYQLTDSSTSDSDAWRAW